jgi:hypothetical protein
MASKNIFGGFLLNLEAFSTEHALLQQMEVVSIDFDENSAELSLPMQEQLQTLSKRVNTEGVQLLLYTVKTERTGLDTSRQKTVGQYLENQGVSGRQIIYEFLERKTITQWQNKNGRKLATERVDILILNPQD